MYGINELESLHQITNCFRMCGFKSSSVQQNGKQVIMTIINERHKIWEKNFLRFSIKYPEDKTEQAHHKKTEDANIEAGIYLYIYYIFFILALKL